jgi:hypothetical protein
MVSDRDYTVHIWREPPAPAAKVLRFETHQRPGPPPAKGTCAWTWCAATGRRSRCPTGGRSHLSHPQRTRRSIPAVFARGAQRDRFQVDFWVVVDQLPAPEPGQACGSRANRGYAGQTGGTRRQACGVSLRLGTRLP